MSVRKGKGISLWAALELGILVVAFIPLAFYAASTLNVLHSLLLAFPQDVIAMDYLAFSAMRGSYESLLAGDLSAWDALLKHPPLAFALQYPIYALTGSGWFFHMVPVLAYPLLLLASLYYFRKELGYAPAAAVFLGLVFSFAYPFFISYGRERELLGMAFAFFPLLLLALRFTAQRQPTGGEKKAMVAFTAASFLVNAPSPLILFPYFFFVLDEFRKGKGIPLYLAPPALYAAYWGAVYIYTSNPSIMIQHMERLVLYPVFEAQLLALCAVFAYLMWQSGGAARQLAAVPLALAGICIFDMLAGISVFCMLPGINSLWATSFIPSIYPPALIFMALAASRSEPGAGRVLAVASLFAFISAGAIIWSYSTISVLSFPEKIASHYSEAGALLAESGALSAAAPGDAHIYRAYNLNSSSANRANLSRFSYSLDIFSSDAEPRREGLEVPVEFTPVGRYMPLVYLSNACGMLPNSSAEDLGLGFDGVFHFLWGYVSPDERERMCFSLPERIYVISNVLLERQCDPSLVRITKVESREKLALYEVRFANSSHTYAWSSQLRDFVPVNE